MPNRSTAGRGRWPPFTLEQLRTFAAVALREHVTGAAAALGMSQGTVSEQVRMLEDALGIALLDRAGRGVRLTEAGRAVQRLATSVLDGVRAIESLGADHADGRRGEVRIGSGHVLGAHRLVAWIARFVEAHPGVHVDIVLEGSTELADRLLAGSVDVAVMSLDAAPAQLETVLLEETEVVLVAAATHPLAADRQTAVERLGDFRQLAHARGSGTDALARQLVRDVHGDAGSVELEEGALLAALRAGLGWAAMPLSVVASDCSAGTLVVLPHRGRSVVQRFSAVRRRGPASAAAAALWEHLADIARAAAAAARA